MIINTTIDDSSKAASASPHHILPQWFLYVSGTLSTLVLALMGLVLMEQATAGYRLSQFFGTMTSEQLLAQSRIELRASNPDRAIATAKAAVEKAPLSQSTLRSYGELLTEAGNDQLALTVMRRAAELGWRDSKTQLYWVQKDAEEGDLESSYRHADALAKRVGMNEQIFQLLTIFLADPTIKSRVLEDLKKPVIWREDFFRNAATTNGQAAEEIGDILLALTNSSVPPSRSEYIPTIAALIKNNRVKKAAAIYTRLSAAVDGQPDAHYNDVGFNDRTYIEGETAARSSPFDWRLFNTRGLTTEIVQNDRSQWVLSANVQSRSQLIIASKVLALDPGTYQLSYAIDQAAPDNARLNWVVSCLADSEETIANPAVNQKIAGDRAIVQFTVNQQCEGQLLRLVIERTVESKNLRITIADLKLESV